jgi:hypothetical protein
MRKLKIIGNFGPVGTKIIDEETGEEIRNVRKVVWTHEVGKAPTCEIELVGVNCEAVGGLMDATPLENPDRFKRWKFAILPPAQSWWKRLCHRFGF